MRITRASQVSAVATEAPATIRIFQQLGIDFCCGGKRPLAEACADRGLDVEVLVATLRGTMADADAERDWQAAPLGDLIVHIQQRFHEPLRQELSRFSAMLAQVVSRHGEHLPGILHPLQTTFSALQDDLLQHMAKEDRVLFPAIVAAEAGDAVAAAWVSQPIAVMEAEHAHAGLALAQMRELTGGYVPPEWACPTFRGLYHGLAEFEREMHVHVHLENNVLFPRAASTGVAVPAP